MVKKADQADYAELGKVLEKILLKDHINIVSNWKRFVFLNFSRGLLIGLGSIVGATLVFALLLWILTLFGELPFVGEIFDSLRKTINQNN